MVNTIFCGNFEEGIQTSWKNGADITGGTYMSIEQNKKTVYITTPYDENIATMNDKLNETYVYYGRQGAYKKEQQSTQDQNAESYSRSNKVDRAISKSSHAYVNSSWDLVDAAKENEKLILETSEEDLPKQMKGMTGEQRKTYVNLKSNERKAIQLEIQSQNKKRQEYITIHTQHESKDATLDAAMIKAIKGQAKSKNLTWQ